MCCDGFSPQVFEGTSGIDNQQTSLNFTGEVCKAASVCLVFCILLSLALSAYLSLVTDTIDKCHHRAMKISWTFEVRITLGIRACHKPDFRTLQVQFLFPLSLTPLTLRICTIGNDLPGDDDTGS